MNSKKSLIFFPKIPNFFNNKVQGGYYDYTEMKSMCVKYKNSDENWKLEISNEKLEIGNEEIHFHFSFYFLFPNI